MQQSHTLSGRSIATQQIKANKKGVGLAQKRILYVRSIRFKYSIALISEQDQFFNDYHDNDHVTINLE